MASLGKLSGTQFTFHSYIPWDRRYNGTTVKPFLGSLAYRQSVAQALTLVPGSLSPFSDHSLSEDLHFVERALRSCNEMRPVNSTSLPLIYTRHFGTGSAAVRNTYRSKQMDEHLEREVARTAQPAFADTTLRRRFRAAEREATRNGGGCDPVKRHPPPDIVYPLLYPHMPRRCRK